MGRRILAMVAGLITAFLIIMLIEGVSIAKYPMAEGADPRDPKALNEHIQSMPAEAFMLILLAYAAGAFMGAFVTVAISKIFRQAIILGLVLLLANTANLVQIEHPLWFAVTSTLLYFPFAWLGGKAGLNVGTKRSDQ